MLEAWDHWGITCHKLAREFDTGDILAKVEFPLGPDECHESLDLKLQLAAQRLALQVATNFEPLWHAATPQGEGSYWKLFTEADRTLDFKQPVTEILRRARAFGERESRPPLGPGPPRNGDARLCAASSWVEPVS